MFLFICFGVVCLCLFDNLLCNDGWRILISGELKGEPASAGGHGAKDGREIAHLAHGNFRDELLNLRLVGRAHAEHAAAALCDIAP